MPPHTDFSSCFNSAEDADVLLYVSTEELEEARSKMQKQQQQGDDRQQTQQHKRTYHTHAVLLKKHSAYFKACLTRDWQPSQQPSQVCGPAAAGSHHRYELVEHMEAAQFEAMEQLLRLMYSQQVPEDAAPELLLQMLWLADHYQADTCTDLLLEHLAAQGAGAATPALLSHIMTLPPGLHSHAVYKTVNDTCHNVAVQTLTSGAAVPVASSDMADACKQYIVQRYQDAAMVAGSEAWRRLFCALPFAAVLSWAGSDQLRVHSENDVVFLLSAWVAANRPTLGFVRVSSPQLEQLAHQVRVLHLTSAYQFHVLPNLEWFKGCSSMQHLPTLLANKGVSSAGVPLYPAPCYSRNSSSSGSWAWKGAPQWVAGPRQHVPDTGHNFVWELTPEQLQQLGRMGSKVLSSSFYRNGFLFHLQLQMNEAASAATDAVKHATLGMYHCVSGHAMAGITWPAAATVPIGTATLKVQAPKAADARSFLMTSLLSSAQCWGSLDMLGRSAATMQELLQPLLINGKLRVQAILQGVDNAE